MDQVIEVAGHQIEPGERQRVEIPVARLPTETWMSLTAEVVNGRRPGPRMWLSAAVHGDELNGVEIIRQVLEQIDPHRLRGSLIAVPVVNVYGFINESRYLPDRRDLNRCFPGSATGSLASRLARIFMTEVVCKSTHGIDLHTGSNHRHNLPQIRADLSHAETRRCAEAFGAPIMINSQTRDGSLRQAAARLGKPVLVYEAGEPLRFDASSIELGVRGVLRVLSALHMRSPIKRRRPLVSVEVAKSTWVRARRSGFIRLQVALGQHVVTKQPLGFITDAFGDQQVAIRAPHNGVVIGYTNNPLVHQGNAVVHLAEPVHAGS